MPLNPAFLGTTTAFSGSLDVFSVQSHHQPNMSRNSSYSFFDEQSHQVAAVSTPEMDFSFLASTMSADAHAMSDGSPLSGDFTTGSNSRTSSHNRSRYYVKWKKRRSLSPEGGTQATHASYWSTPTTSSLTSSNLVDPALQDETAPDWAANLIDTDAFGPHSMPPLHDLDKFLADHDLQSFAHQDIQSFSPQDMSLQDIQSMLFQGVQPISHQNIQSLSNQDAHRRSISYQDVQPNEPMSHQNIESLPNQGIDSLPNQDERRRSISYEELQSMSPRAIQAMSHQEMQAISLQAIQSMSHQDTAIAY
ncbi:hypothetical protein E4U58_000548 [Claviceps cyperi]|nr:hypothetical protein E4U58_000548 [Claviceps cyperi]